MRLRSDDLSWTESDAGEIVVLDLRTSRYLSINAAGATLWRPLLDGASADELELALVREFGIPSDQARADVQQFVDVLRQRELLAPPG